jgi:membrane protein DedA with SNARE-associated domain
VGYYLGYKGGRPFVERFGAIFRIRPEHIARSELFFARHGDRAVLLARFVLGLRTWGSMLAGMARMPFWRFQLFSAIGGLAWAVIIGVAGYLLGSNLALLETIIRDIGLGGLLVLVAVVFILVVARRRA